MSRHVRAGVATVAIICSSINVWHWQHRPRTVGALNGTRVPKQLSFSVVHGVFTRTQPLDRRLARCTCYGRSWTCRAHAGMWVGRARHHPQGPHRLRTPRLFISSVYFIPFLSRLFMSINLTVYHLPRSLHSSVNALLSSSAPSARRTEAFCLCVCASVCTCVCVCMYVCV